MMEFVQETALGLGKLLLLVFVIIVPLMVALELFRHYKLLEMATNFIAPVTRRLGFGPDSVFPLMAGIVFGISYGGGVLIGEARKGRIIGNQAFLVAVFLALCHAIFEDTLLFVSQGAVGWIVVVIRLAAATVITGLVALRFR